MWATDNKTTEEKIKNVYSKYTIQQFWDWWSDNNPQDYMEVRIRNMDIIREIGDKYKIPWNASGVYVNSYDNLKKVMAYARDKTVLWFGINPRMKNHTKRGLRFGGGDAFVPRIKFLFVDIDRTVKLGEATNEDLNNATFLAKEILNKLNEHGWDKNYCLICSGNGIQLLVKLDIPVSLPKLVYDSKTESFIQDVEYTKIKDILKLGIGKDIAKFCTQFKQEYKVEIDQSCFRISGVGALPFTKNFKYGGFTWRGIVELKEGNNVGFTDYIMSKEKDIKVYRKTNVFKVVKTRSGDSLIAGKLKEHKLVRFMMDNEFPEGYINNTLWFQLKLLIRDSGVDTNTDEFKELHRELKHKHGRAFSTNVPGPQYVFDKRVINNYCITHLIPPLYEVKEIKTRKMDYGIQDVDTDRLIKVNIEKLELKPETSFLEDLSYFKKRLIEGDYFNNNLLYLKFLKGIVEKYNIKTADYIVEYLMDFFIFGGD